MTSKHTSSYLARAACSTRALFTLALLGLLTAGLPLHAQSETFGENGELLRVVAGSYESLFGSQGPAPGTAADNSVMALEVTQPSGERTVHLVPGTEGSESEVQPTIAFNAGQTFLLWGSRVGPRASMMNVIGFDGESWTETIEVSGDPVPFKGLPRVAVTRDSYGTAANPTQRTILHLVWWESRDGAVIVFYSPITLLDGAYIGWNPVVALNQFETHSPETDSPLAANHRNLSLYKAANVELGPDGRTVVVSLPQFEKERLQSLRMHVLPASLNVLADEVRSHIIGAGRGHRASILGLGDEVRSHIIGAGATLHPGVLEYIAEEVYIEVLGFGGTFDPEDVDEIAERAWVSTLESGGSLLSGTEATGMPCNLLHIGEDAAGFSDHQVEICLMSDRPVPATGEGGHSLLLSESGREAMIVWKDDDGNLHYRQSQGPTGWAEARELSIGETLSFDRALRALRVQARNR